MGLSSKHVVEEIMLLFCYSRLMARQRLWTLSVAYLDCLVLATVLSVSNVGWKQLCKKANLPRLPGKDRILEKQKVSVTD